jgi:hypothetical protein
VGAAAIAAFVALALMRRRLRRPGEAGRPADQNTFERAADLPLKGWVDQELADLAAAMDGRGLIARPVAVEFSATTGLEVLWDQPATVDAPRPWEAVPGGWAWRCVYDPDAPVSPQRQPSPIAGLATLGRRDGRQLLVDLESLGSLAVAGDPRRAEAFVRSLVLELTAHDVESDVRVLAVDGVVDIDDTHGVDHLDQVGLEDALGRITAAVHAHSLSDGDPRGFGQRAELAEPAICVAVVASGPDARRFIDAAPRRRGTAVIILGDAAAATTITIDGAGTGHLEPLGLTFEATGVRGLAAQGPSPYPTPATGPSSSPSRPPAQRPPIDDVLTPGPSVMVRSSIETPPGGIGPPAPAPGPCSGSIAVIDRFADCDDHWTLPEVRLLIEVLGVPSVRDRPRLRRRELAIVVYVACMSRPVTQDDVQEAIWGGEPVSEKTVSNLVGHCRATLGDWDGLPILGRVTNGTMRLADGVKTDHQLFEALTTRAGDVASSQARPLLHQALDLIGGPPFNADGYEWAHTSQLVAGVEARIERATLDLVALELDGGQLNDARRAAAQGLRALPGNEVLYRERIRIEELAGNTKGAHAALSELLSYLEDLGTEPSTVTLTEFGHLLGDRTHHSLARLR